MRTDANSVVEGITLSADIVVIGAGPAGIALAKREVAYGRNVILVESSELDDLAATALNQGSISGHQIIDGFGNTRTLDTTRRRAMGGATRANDSNLSLPRWAGYTGQADFDWGVITSTSLLPYYLRAHDLIGLGPVDFTPAYWQGVVGQTIPASILEDWTLFQRHAKDFSDYMPELETHGNINVVVNGNAVYLNMDPSGVTVQSVTVKTLSGVSFTVAGTVVVLTAGALESARLMLRSNNVVPAGVGNQSDQVGKCFGDDLGLSWGLALVNLPANTWFGGKMGVATQTPSGTPATVDLILNPTLSKQTLASIGLPHFNFGGLMVDYASLQVAQGSGANTLMADEMLTANSGKTTQAFVLRVLMDTVVNPASRVTLNWGKKDALGTPQLDVNWQTTAEDDANFYRAWTKCAKAIKGHLLASFGALSLNSLSSITLGNMGDMPVLNWQTQYHHNFLLRMGSDPASSVVDTNLRVHTVTNLYTVNSGVFQTPIGVPPTATLVALSERLADHLHLEVLT